jgi:hypothetical protein
MIRRICNLLCVVALLSVSVPRPDYHHSYFCSPSLLSNRPTSLGINYPHPIGLYNQSSCFSTTARVCLSHFVTGLHRSDCHPPQLTPQKNATVSLHRIQRFPLHRYPHWKIHIWKASSPATTDTCRGPRYEVATIAPTYLPRVGNDIGQATRRIFGPQVFRTSWAILKPYVFPTVMYRDPA